MSSRSTATGNRPFHPLAGVFAIIAVLTALLTFRGFYIHVAPDDPSVLAVETSWWGLSETKRRIRWMQPSGLDYAAWCTRSNDGEWYPYLVEDHRDYYYD
jgi:hypothetical protein